jgi:outer membrane protein OmpA-like peptidoglycan-associated protein
MLSFGGGAGAVHQQFDDGVIDQDEDYNFAYQGIVGASYELSPRMDLTLNYRYLRSDAAEFRGAAGPTNFYETDDFENQAVTIGLRFDLGPDAAPVAAAPPPTAPEPPPPAAPPAPPAPPKQFLVFFGFDKSNLTEEARRVISEAAAAAKQFGSATIRVVGHADTVGSKGYNQGLSERRANAVRQGLVAEGIPADKITAAGRGETELLVQTGDNVKEPQNRRSSIDLE